MTGLAAGGRALCSPPRLPAASDSWATPIRPLQYEQMWCVWEYGGVYEWMVHPDMAANLQVTGIKVDGVWCPVERVGEWPRINAVQIRAVKEGRGEDVYPMTAAAA